jgi:hypothetical protein
MTLLTCSASIVLSWSQEATQRETPLEVREVVDVGSKYANKLVVVKGCHVEAFEVDVLQPCDGKFDKHKYSIWVDEGRSGLGRLGTWDHLTPVILKGDYKTGRRQYGHLGAYRHSFLVHELLWHGEPQNPLKVDCQLNAER